MDNCFLSLPVPRTSQLHPNLSSWDCSTPCRWVRCFLIVTRCRTDWEASKRRRRILCESASQSVCRSVGRSVGLSVCVCSQYKQSLHCTFGRDPSRATHRLISVTFKVRIRPRLPHIENFWVWERRVRPDAQTVQSLLNVPGPGSSESATNKGRNP